ncbi:hypothetical protein SDRG_13718 [Saprolegnia diclina VS20]|uniref:Uncharacterized protein n=1 Tax=Saprolegnia diclina (strain VS20) TaxID=1156394 RepID=T0Q5D5_SAPDV|nr:hypothetical protein SDRG_13718 [Saprolegnia diclina VS20]EQC28640.1 hypothetical protein SDRG_13718 [Saprolegnia diclina VS20]|eukprot:XP_008618037.1 hypothetical protein SDRG_13718 [Saprolegnia diclina VS20]
MEDLDDEPALHADANGEIHLNHGTWIRLDDVIWTQGQRLLVLNVEGNQILELPPLLGNLVLLRVLNVASNRLTALPDEIGYCAQLLHLHVQHNYLKAIPKGIQGCQRLELLDASENNLKTLPIEMRKLPEIQTIDVRNNQLVSLPPVLSDCPRLITLACDGNKDLTQIPESLRDNSRLVLWILQRLKEHAVEIKHMTDINNDLEAAARRADDEKLQLKDAIVHLEREKKALLDERPDKYLKLKTHVQAAAIKSLDVTSQVCRLM